MGEATDQQTTRAAALVDELVAEQKVLARAQARRAALMLEFSDIRSRHVPAARCDLDHVIPVPEGPTTASNLDDKCRSDHRAMAAPAIGNMMLRAGAPQRLSALGHVEVGQN